MRAACYQRSGCPDLSVRMGIQNGSYYPLGPRGRRRFVRQLQGHSRRLWGALERVAEDRQRNRAFFSSMVRGVSNAREGSKILTFLFRPRLVCSSLLHLRSSWKVNSPRAGYRFTEFFEVHLWAAERWSVIRVMSSSCSQLRPVKEDSSSIRNSTSDLSSPWSARSARRRGKPNIS